MKQFIIVFISCFVLFSCNNGDDEHQDPIVEEGPDLSFPECLLSDDVFEYNLIMSNPPTEPRGQLLKAIYQGIPTYSFNQNILNDYILVIYNEQCEVVCQYVWNGSGTDCIGNPADHEFIGVVWTDPR